MLGDKTWLTSVPMHPMGLSSELCVGQLGKPDTLFDTLVNSLVEKKRTFNKLFQQRLKHTNASLYTVELRLPFI